MQKSVRQTRCNAGNGDTNTTTTAPPPTTAGCISSVADCILRCDAGRNPSPQSSRSHPALLPRQNPRSPDPTPTPTRPAPTRPPALGTRLDPPVTQHHRSPITSPISELGRRVHRGPHQGSGRCLSRPPTSGLRVHAGQRRQARFPLRADGPHRALRDQSGRPRIRRASTKRARDKRGFARLSPREPGSVGPCTTQ